MSRIQTGPRVALERVPDGLAAHARVVVHDSEDGARTVRDRRGRLSLRHGVVLVQDLGQRDADPGGAAQLAASMDDDEVADVVAVVDEAAGRSMRGYVLGAGGRSASGWSKLARGFDGALDLARAGVVELQAPVVEGHRLEPPTRWTLTPVGLRAGEWLREGDEGRMDALVRAVSDLDTDGELGAIVSTDPDAFLGAGVSLLEERGWPPHPALEREALCATDREAVAVAGRLLDRLPFDRRPLSVVAVEVTGDTHGLDPGRPFARIADLVLEVAGDEAPRRPAAAAERQRDHWDQAGIATDGYASTAVVWGLPGAEDHPLGGLLEHGRRHSVVLHVGLDLVRRRPAGVRAPADGSPGWLFTCENAAMLQWASTRSVDAPVVLAGGQPSIATRELLWRAVEVGWRIAVGADFEPGGLAAAGALLAEFGDAAEPWRLSAEDYRLGPASGSPITSAPPQTHWDPDLAEALAGRGRRVTEEDRWDVLTRDLARGTPGVE